MGYHRYVAEATCAIENAALASVVLFLSLVAFRMALELVYRLAFGDARLKLSTQLGAFSAPVVAWGLIWTWHGHRITAT